jgi:hypothetical protein
LERAVKEMLEEIKNKKKDFWAQISQILND